MSWFPWQTAMNQGFYINGKSVSSVPLKHMPGTGYAILQATLLYIAASGRKVRAMCGMPTDGLSIPRFFWRVAGPPFRHVYLLAALIHDHLCKKAASLPVGAERDALRLAADMLFREMCLFIKPKAKVRASVLYAAVRLGAWWAKNEPIAPDYEHEPDRYTRLLQG